MAHGRGGFGTAGTPGIAVKIYIIGAPVFIAGGYTFSLSPFTVANSVADNTSLSDW